MKIAFCCKMSGFSFCFHGLVGRRILQHRSLLDVVVVLLTCLAAAISPVVAVRQVLLVKSCLLPRRKSSQHSCSVLQGFLPEECCCGAPLSELASCPVSTPLGSVDNES